MNYTKIVTVLKAQLKRPRTIAALTLLAVWAGLPPGVADVVVQAVVSAVGG